MGNLLSEVHPELIEQWSERNLPLTPDKITYGSNKIVWWKGACGHEWQTSVKARSNGENMPALMRGHADRRHRRGTIHTIRQLHRFGARIIVIRQLSADMFYRHVGNACPAQNLLRRLRACDTRPAPHIRILPKRGIHIRRCRHCQQKANQYENHCRVKIQTIAAESITAIIRDAQTCLQYIHSFLPSFWSLFP